MPPTPLVPGDLVRIRDERWIVARHTPGGSAAVVDVHGKDPTNLGARASFLLPFELVERLASSTVPRRVRPRLWRRLTRAMLEESTPSWQALRTPLRARIALLAFQLEPALAVTHGVASRILIADEVGLGKTIQAGLVISEILSRTRHGRVLIVAPASLREQWRDELRERFGLEAWLADSASIARLGAMWTTSRNPWSVNPATITSIDYIKRPEVMRSLEALVWDGVVFDEAHALAGRSDRAAAAGALARRARTVVMLTATPHTGDDQAFDHLCRVGDLDDGFPLLVFRRTRQDVGLTVLRRTTSLRVRPSLAEQEMHRALMSYAHTVWSHTGPSANGARLAMTVLARRACSSAASLARSIERRLALLDGDDPTVTLQMVLPLFDSADDEPAAELSAPGLADRAEERRRLAHILQLARRAQPAESKLRALERLLRRAGEPAIVFTEYRDTLIRLAAFLCELTPVLLHGGLTATERRDNLRRFTAGTARLLLATDAASEGLNLQQRCRLVINLELPWTPLRLEQRIGRVERIGQGRRVHAVHLLGAGTTEESSVAHLLMRAGRAAVILDSLRPGTTEEHVACAAIGRETRTRPAPPHEPSGPHILVPGLQAAAHEEAARLGRLRLLTGRRSEVPFDGRPPVTLLHRRKDTRGCLWGFRLMFTDADQELVWETILGVVTPAPPCGPRSGDLSRWIEDTAGLLASTVDPVRRTALARLEAARSASLDLASRRERSIARALTVARARLSAGLLQPGLFDRRAERVFATQNAVLEEALERCRARLDAIAAARQLVPEPQRLAFAVVRR